MYAVRGAPPAPSPGVAPHPSVSRRPGLRAIGVAALLSAAFGMGLAGGIVGGHIKSPAAPAPSAAAAAQPSADEVRAQTVDLCTRYAAGYGSIRSPQNEAADIVPAANYVSDALRENAYADPSVRAAVMESLRLMREHGAALSHEPARGAVQPPNGFRAAPANAADDQVWDRCWNYEG
ncbi:Uncharacterised protein [Mycobacteroides abscessus subsp. abscessus]|nr:Uncharacterised protein [Mycobacteroides abscessus subsp. abscessus]SHQ50710.1 Uncharacterised protein [Mycobacteroides abscessus subsp. abscessus]SHQ51991.1 Uncharacterised protein [Mycobacteroides abscessus subsp. abscessus]SHS76668.1 Uncharacterised protein [Mycobacteroides abscessus subsp. abscessus]SHT52724.1 Uncharacterised protein [Mycobacteroides abscessus subsp. abscessus]